MEPDMYTSGPMTSDMTSGGSVYIHSTLESGNQEQDTK